MTRSSTGRCSSAFAASRTFRERFVFQVSQCIVFKFKCIYIRRIVSYTASLRWLHRSATLRETAKVVEIHSKSGGKFQEIIRNPDKSQNCISSFFFFFLFIHSYPINLSTDCLIQLPIFFKSSDYVNNFWTSKTFGLISSWIGNKSKQDLPGKYVHKLLWIGMGSYVNFPCYRDMFKYSFLTITFSNDLSWKFHKNPTNVFPFCLFKGCNVIKCCYGIAFDVKHYRKMKINRFFLFLQSAV